MTPAEHQKAMTSLITKIGRDTGQRVWEVFSDWIECAAISLSNTLPHRDHAAREERFARHQDTYGAENMTRFSHLLGHLTMWLEQEPTDALGQLYMRLDLGNAHTGQFFTPFEVSELMAGLTITSPQDLQERINTRGFITVSEPTCGAGGMLIAFANRMRDAGLNPQQQAHFTGVDIDITCVHMTFTQLSLLGLPAVIIHGDVLKLEERSHWITPMHHAGLWRWRLQREPADVQAPAAVVEQPALFEVVT